LAVTVNLHPWFSEIAGGQQAVRVTGSTVGECLAGVYERFQGLEARLVNSEGKIKAYITVLLNGENTYPEELSMPVSDGDEISFVFVIDGG